MKRYTIGFAIAVIALFSINLVAREPLTFEERVKAQEAIERVYYNHRIWPKENPQPKPPFEQMVTKEQIEAKVTDYLKKSAALDQFWQRPIEGKQLQAEMERMAKGTKDPQTLNELFMALNDDPYLIAECLARPVLADRLIRNWYANDERFKGMCVLNNITRLDELLEDIDMSGGSSEFQEVADENFRNPIIELDSIEDWQAVTTTGAPISRDWHCAVWTGTEMIIWGGTHSADTPLNDGSRYYPSTDNWIQMSLTGAPTERGGAAVVWTGIEMVVWGGHYYKNDGHSSYNVNTGGRYNPTTDNWKATSTNNSPSARVGHEAIWTGTEMIIWGGRENSETLVSTGGKYNPYKWSHFLRQGTVLYKWETAR